ncbi:nucleotidyltransferase family protein [Streptomyces bambusae]|uniref:nucleotidyltransferase family protein n=1 Tax=Streptomyces bambusae TaxID=1550616 RepID=UPI001CFF242E|nr:nucleotidyltransferase family protein [Streptomyces bambusae]MCB5166989.1 nucleotidyltransferase family protein [Streptomyces bambusae]
MTTARLIDQLTLPLLRGLLGLDDDAPPYVLTEAAAAVRSTVPQLVLSAAQRCGEELGSGSRDTLARARQRAAAYEEILRRVVKAVPGARVVKGASLARHYPDSLLRPVGDMDLMVATEQQVWEAAAAVLDSCPVQDTAVVLHGSRRPLPFVTLTWPGTDRWLDKPMKAEIVCTPLTGNAGAVGVRPLAAPRDSCLPDLLSVCEERFQRRFNAKDIADVLVLADTGLPPAARIVDTAAAHQLAPELHELLSYAAAHCDIGPFAAVVDLLGERAAAERSRREAWRRPRTLQSLDHPVWRALAYGVPVPSIPLRRAARPDARIPVRYEPLGAHLLHHTPIGDFLLTVEQTVSRDDYDRAVRRSEAQGEAEPTG